MDLLTYQSPGVCGNMVDMRPDYLRNPESAKQCGRFEGMNIEAGP
jgi:hypothetical protein